MGSAQGDRPRGRHVNNEALYRPRDRQGAHRQHADGYTHAGDPPS